MNSDPESDVESESTDRLPHSLTVSVTSTSSEAVLSSGWMLSGSYTIDHAGSSSRLEVPVSLLNALFQERARHSPVRMEHIIIFANKFCSIRNHLCTVSIRSYIYVIMEFTNRKTRNARKTEDEKKQNLEDKNNIINTTI